MVPANLPPRSIGMCFARRRAVHIPRWFFSIAATSVQSSYRPDWPPRTRMGGSTHPAGLCRADGRQLRTAQSGRNVLATGLRSRALPEAPSRRPRSAVVPAGTALCERRSCRGYRLVPRWRTALYAIGARGIGPPAQPAHGPFRAAVAFYPASCDDRRQQGWASHIPLLVLLGAEDVWTPAVPCIIFLDGAVGRGARIEVQVYPDAYHGFDRADSPRRELPEYRTAAGIVPIIGTDPVPRQDVLSRVPAFLARFIMN
jgi:hypothetical protein